MAKAEILRPFVLSWEGGFVDHPLDRGGATNKGVTIATFRRVFGEGSTVEQLKAMTDGQWQTVFKKYYWDRWRADSIADQSVANMLVDWLWASGAYAIRLPQQLLGVRDDGMVGRMTLEAINAHDPKKLLERLHDRRMVFLRSIVANRPSQAAFMKGWKRRIDGIGYGRLVCNGGKILKF